MVVVGSASVQVPVHGGHRLAHKAVLLAEAIEAVVEEHALAVLVILQHAAEGEGLLARSHGAHEVARAGLHAQQLGLVHGQWCAGGLQTFHQSTAKSGLGGGGLAQVDNL